MILDRALFLAGPTAVGKSAIAFSLARRIQGEIISVDSMQVYRGLDVGTAKPTQAEQTLVPHHLVDILDVTEAFDAATWARKAEVAADEIRGRGRPAIFCGGTGLYFQALLEGLGQAPASDPAVRREIEQTPLSDLLEELRQTDPQLYERMDRQNARRVIRAVEVIRLSGQAYSAQRATWRGGSRGSEFGPAKYTAGGCFFAIERAKEDLRRRIEGRVDAMFERGLVEETKRLMAQGLSQNRTAIQAIGYRQVIEHLRGNRTLEETIAPIKQRTWQLARRQLNWFRNQMNFEWIMLDPMENPETVAERLANAAGLPARCKPA